MADYPVGSVREMNGLPLPLLLLCLEPAGGLMRLWLEPLGHYFRFIEGDVLPIPPGDSRFFLFGVGLGCGVAQIQAVRFQEQVAGLLLCAPTGRPDLEQCQAINVPAIILAGRHDSSAQVAEQFHAALPDSRLVIFDGSGRFPFADEPGNFERVIRDWLAIL
jgi:pimeloyl-ACP methyl ester carboxylesterase